MSNVPPPSQAPQPPFPGPHHPEAACLLTFMVVFPVEGQGVALGVLFPLLLGQVGVGVVIAEPRPVLIPFPTDWRAERAGRASQPSQPMPPPPWPPGSYLPLCQKPEHPPNRVWNRRWGGQERTGLWAPLSLFPPLQKDSLSQTYGLSRSSREAVSWRFRRPPMPYAWGKSQE